MNPEEEREGIDFGVAKSLRYHAYRRSFWGSWDTAAKTLTVVSGAAVLVTIVGDHKLTAKVLAFIVAITSAMDLVIGFSRMARDHDDLYRAFSKLAQDIAVCRQPDEKAVTEWQRRRLEIEMDEKLIGDWLERRCAAEEALARGLDVNSAWKLSGLQFHLAQLSFWSRRPDGMKPSRL